MADVKDSRAGLAERLAAFGWRLAEQKHRQSFLRYCDDKIGKWGKKPVYVLGRRSTHRSSSDCVHVRTRGWEDYEVSRFATVKSVSRTRFPSAYSSIPGQDHDMDGFTGFPSAPARIVDISCAQFRLIRGFLSSLRAARSQSFHR